VNGPADGELWPAYVFHFRIASRRGLKCDAGSREGAIINTVWLFLALLPAVAGAQDAADPPTPWATVNGSAEGYSIKLESASPTPGTPLAVGQTVEFKIRVSYQLSIADTGVVVLVVQDEANKNLMGDRKQQSQPAARGHGDLTLIENVVVPSDAKEVRLFVPIVPNGISHTSGELLIRYPVTGSGKTSAIGYPTVAAALADLHSKPDVKFSIQNGWTIAEDRANSNFWSFPPEGDPAYPSAVKRTLVQTSEGINLDMKVLCQSTQAACDKLVADFKALNERMRDSFKSK
jgi:hypothetical protein